MQPKDSQPLPTTNKYGEEVKVQRIVSRKRKGHRPASGDNTISPFERFASSNGRGNKFTSW